MSECCTIIRPYDLLHIISGKTGLERLTVLGKVFMMMACDLFPEWIWTKRLRLIMWFRMDITSQLPVWWLRCWTNPRQLSPDGCAIAGARLTVVTPAPSPVSESDILEWCVEWTTPSPHELERFLWPDLLNNAIEEGEGAWATCFLHQEVSP